MRYSAGVTRALTDFGAEKSYQRAAERFAEHYGWSVGRTTLRSRTLDVARDAEQFLADTIEAARQEFIDEERERVAGTDLLVELDGCEIRTGTIMTAEEAGRGELPPEKRVRVERWREVRTGLVRPLDEVDATYVCKLASYPVICGQLFGAACLRGYGTRTRVVGVADGGNGLCEELAVHFAGMQFILDRPHLKSHVWDTAVETGMAEPIAKRWMASIMERLHQGDAAGVLDQLRVENEHEPHERRTRLIGYLTRFEHAVHYDEYLAQGWPIGSGEVESAHRYIPQERLKIAGATWHPDNVNPMLSLRVVRANGWWDDLWQWRAQRAAA